MHVLLLRHLEPILFSTVFNSSPSSHLKNLDEPLTSGSGTHDVELSLAFLLDSFYDLGIVWS